MQIITYFFNMCKYYISSLSNLSLHKSYCFAYCLFKQTTRKWNWGALISGLTKNIFYSTTSNGPQVQDYRNQWYPWPQPVWLPSFNPYSIVRRVSSSIFVRKSSIISLRNIIDEEIEAQGSKINHLYVTCLY